MVKNIRYKTRIAIIGAGQAGLSAAYYLKKLHWQVGKDFIILDESPIAGGAWQHRWDPLTLSTVNHIHDLPECLLPKRLPNQLPTYRPTQPYHIISICTRRNLSCRF